MCISFLALQLRPLSSAASMKTPIAVWKYCILYQQSAINIASPAFNISFFKGGKREAPHNVSCSDTLLDFFFFLFYQSLVNESKQTFILKCCFLMSFVCVRVNVSGGSTNVPIHFLWHCLETSDSPVSLNVYWHFSRARQKKKNSPQSFLFQRCIISDIIWKYSIWVGLG